MKHLLNHYSLSGCSLPTPTALSFIKIPFIICVLSNYFFFFWTHCIACGILVPRPGVEPMFSAMEAQVLITEPLEKPQTTFYQKYVSVFVILFPTNFIG